jgi:DNA-directed RNA polymerase specialized sigma24 family protein
MPGAKLEEIEDLYRREFGRFLRVATAVAGDEERGLDAVQEGFARAIRHRKGFRGEGPLAAWVWKAVVNAARKGWSVRPPLALAPNPGPNDDESAAVREAVARLPERQRLVLFLRYYADLDYATIAASLGVSPGTVGATLNAAHATLRKGVLR